MAAEQFDGSMTDKDHLIEAHHRTLSEVLSERKFTVDYFQREYSWEQKHIEQLVTDLTSAFLNEYDEKHARKVVRGYNRYYLGPFVISRKRGVDSIIDGQQRLTSLTLFLIFLNHLQRDVGTVETIAPMVFSEKYGEKSFNIQVEERRPCLEGLFLEGRYELPPDADESTRNMVERYSDIGDAFPEELKGKALPYFLDWFKHNVVLVEITAYSDENAYTIFESMNDRGQNLTSTEMLKGYVLSRFQEQADRDKANRLWKDAIQTLHSHSREEDQRFFQAWFRGQYADTIRQGKAGSSNEDFEKIGTRFHSWFRDNLSKVGVDVASAEGFKHFVHRDMRYFLHAYVQILDAQSRETAGWEQVFYHHQWGIADSLSLPLMLAPLTPADSPDETRLKINEVARYMEAFAVRRAINFRKFGASSIRYTMYSLVKDIRARDLQTLQQILQQRLTEMPETWDGAAEFRMHGMNRWFVKFLLSRITAFIEQQAGGSTSFSTYFVSPGTKPFEVEHIWADKFAEHRDEFDQQHEFEAYRHRIGDLVLLPQGTNQSYGAMSYEKKLEHYLKENLLVKSLHRKAYENNPNFSAMAETLDLPFSPHDTFRKKDIDARQQLVQRICNKIWS
jgi:hypothetical protein